MRKLKIIMDLPKANTHPRSSFIENRAESFRWLFPALLALTSVIVLIPVLPGLLQIPGADPGTPVLVGSQLLLGKFPYRDFWDAQPPLIYLLNGLGLALGGSSRVGIWAVELVSLLTFGILLFRSLFRYFGAFIAACTAVGAVLCLSGIPNFSNSAEFYGLPFQAAVLLLVIQIADHPSQTWRYLVLGCCIGLLASLRITLIGIGVVAGLYLLIQQIYHHQWRGVPRLLWIIAGFILVWIAWLALFSAAHSLPDFVDQVFRYPLYSWRGSNNDRLRTLLQGMNALFHGSAFLTLGLASWLAVLPFLVLKESAFRKLISSRPFGIFVLLVGVSVLINGVYNDTTHQLFSLQTLSLYRITLIVVGLAITALSTLILLGRFYRILAKGVERFQPGESSGLLPLLCIALLDLPLELGLAALPMRNDAQLFIPVIPSLAILLSFLLWSLQPDEDRNQSRQTAWFCQVVLILAVVATGLVTTYNTTLTRQSKEITNLLAYLKANARPGDSILQWSANPQIYYMAGLTPASRYLDLQPLFTRGYTSPERVQAFLNELRTTRPRFIIDTQFWNNPLLIPRDQSQCSQLQDEKFIIDLQEKDRFRWDNPLMDRPYVPAGMGQVYQWICENYQVATEVGRVPWFVYALRQKNP